MYLAPVIDMHNSTKCMTLIHGEHMKTDIYKLYIPLKVMKFFDPPIKCLYVCMAVVVLLSLLSCRSNSSTIGRFCSLAAKNYL